MRVAGVSVLRDVRFQLQNVHMRLLAGPPADPETEIRSVPQVLSWDAKGSVPQERLIPYQEELRHVVGPLTGGGLSVNLRASFPAAELHFGRDLDNLLDPVVAALGPEHIVAAWGTKAESTTSSVAVGQPAPIDGDALGGWYRARIRVESFTDFKARVAAQLAGRVSLPSSGPVELIVAFTIGPGRAWRNLWKPAIDVLGGVLGRNNGQWTPQDERIVRLGLTYDVLPDMGHAIGIDYWYRMSTPGPITTGPRHVLGIDGYPRAGSPSSCAMVRSRVRALQQHSPSWWLRTLRRWSSGSTCPSASRRLEAVPPMTKPERSLVPARRASSRHHHGWPSKRPRSRRRTASPGN
jgi:hypothetical protein